MITVYGIPNCDTIKKTLKWLDKNKVNYHFHDLRKDPVSKTLIKKWICQAGTESLINKKSTTFRGLTNQKQEALLTDNAVEIIEKNPTIIKRPLIVSKEGMMIGYDEKQFKTLL